MCFTHRFHWRTSPSSPAHSFSTWMRIRNGGTASSLSQTPITSVTMTTKRWGEHKCLYRLFYRMLVSLTAQHDNPAPCLHYQAHDRHLHPKGTINCAGYKVLTSIEQYMDLISNCLPGEAEDGINADHFKQFFFILFHFSWSKCHVFINIYFIISNDSSQKNQCDWVGNRKIEWNKGASEIWYSINIRLLQASITLVIMASPLHQMENLSRLCEEPNRLIYSS